jgi:hypothetical protein
MEYKIRTHEFDGRGVVEKCRLLPGNRIVYMGDPPTDPTSLHFSRTTVADVHLLQTALAERFKAVVLAIDGPEYLPE